MDELQTDSTGEPPREGNSHQSFVVNAQRLPPKILQNGPQIIPQNRVFHIEQADNPAAGREGGHIRAPHLRILANPSRPKTKMIAYYFHLQIVR